MMICRLSRMALSLGVLLCLAAPVADAVTEAQLRWDADCLFMGASGEAGCVIFCSVRTRRRSWSASWCQCSYPGKPVPRGTAEPGSARAAWIRFRGGRGKRR